MCNIKTGKPFFLKRGNYIFILLGVRFVSFWHIIIGDLLFSISISHVLIIHILR